MLSQTHLHPGCKLKHSLLPTSAGFLVLWFWGWRHYVPAKHWAISKLHRITTQKTNLINYFKYSCNHAQFLQVSDSLIFNIGVLKNVDVDRAAHKGGNPDKCWGSREKKKLSFLSFLHSLVIFSSLKFPPNCLWCAVIYMANFASNTFPQKLFNFLKLKQ
jgi:hypothetical protein